MKDWRSQSHVKWDCKYHVVIVPTYRRRRFYGSLRSEIGKILRQLCGQQGVELVKGNALSDHVHLLLSVPPKFSIANTVGFLKGKSAIRINRDLGRVKGSLPIDGPSVTVVDQQLLHFSGAAILPSLAFGSRGRQSPMLGYGNTNPTIERPVDKLHKTGDMLLEHPLSRIVICSLVPIPINGFREVSTRRITRPYRVLR